MNRVSTIEDCMSSATKGMNILSALELVLIDERPDSRSTEIGIIALPWPNWIHDLETPGFRPFRGPPRDQQTLQPTLQQHAILWTELRELEAQWLQVLNPKYRQ
jgi:hypothetical protein